ncbi:MAG: RNA polymerase sigma-70 factor [Salinivirgaceae bacterium]|nr:RNA polymerase sigma-70 factor [Salinivirgaceae bacterium]
MINPQESILIEGLQEGNKKIFDYLFHCYYSGLVVYAIKYVTEKEAAEDLVQDFFFKLWMQHKQLTINQTIKSYFFVSVKNRCLDYLRHSEIKQKASDYFSSVREESITDANDFLVEAELSSRIEKALNNLPEKSRQVFIMNRFNGFSPKEIAEKENLSIRTVEGHIGKALKLLRLELEPYLPELLLIMVIQNLPAFFKLP